MAVNSVYELFKPFRSSQVVDQLSVYLSISDVLLSVTRFFANPVGPRKAATGRPTQAPYIPPLRNHSMLPGGNTSAADAAKKQASIAPKPLAKTDTGQFKRIDNSWAKHPAVVSPMPMSVTPPPGGHQSIPKTIALTSPSSAARADAAQLTNSLFMFSSRIAGIRKGFGLDEIGFFYFAEPVHAPDESEIPADTSFQGFFPQLSNWLSVPCDNRYSTE
ncbi:hypothetical protein [Stieleria varia]|uniref:hypothetical protein n=1 Tax=Stieleria varia TaxID=2528005 RepID=UPI0011B749C4|nr:hypothetical protein [Stieleria varia]